MSFDEVLESGDSGIELPHFSSVIVLSLLDCFKQSLGDALQGVGVEVGAAGQDVGC